MLPQHWSAPRDTLLGAPYGQGGAERPLDQLLETLVPDPDCRSHNCATRANCFPHLSLFLQQNRDNNTPSGCWQDYIDNRQELLGLMPGTQEILADSQANWIPG